MAATCAVLAFALPCASQEPPAGSTRPRLLVLNSGKVVTGDITPRPDGYNVRKGAGRLFIASQTVRFEATDMADAYAKLRRTFKELTPETHIRIARWCLANSQVNSARRELLDALRLEPHNTTAQTILKRMEADVVKTRTKPKVTAQTIAQKGMDQFLQTPHESLGGLTDKQAGVFVSRIQPILERRCGNSSCHGSASTTDFILKRTRGRSSRLTAERNLAVVLQYVDFKQPTESQLLGVMDRPHTRDGRPLFSGRAGTIQERIIRDWVASITEETKSSAVANEKKTVAVSRTEKKTASLSTEEKQLVEEVRASNEKDPFDPAEFNRKHHRFGTRNQSTRK